MPRPFDAEHDEGSGGHRPSPERRVPQMPLLPPPDVVRRLLAALPPGETRRAADAALRRLSRALGARWAGERMRLVAAQPRERAESGAVHIFRIIDSGWRFADDPASMRGLRRTLMPDGVGRALYRDWPVALAWMQAIVAALQAPAVAEAHSRHLGRMLEFFVDEVDAASRVSPLLPDGTDTAVLAAARSLDAALVDALAEYADAGGDLDRLVAGLREPAAAHARGGPHSAHPVEPDAGRGVRPTSPAAEIEDVDE